MGDNRYYRNHRNHGNKSNKGNRPNKNTDDCLTEAPHPQIQTIAELEKALSENITEKTLVSSTAIAWNKFAWFAENESKFEGDIDKYSDACNLTDSWNECYYRLIEKLKAFENVPADATFALPEITALMNKYGFEDIEGYWKISRPQK